MGRTNDFVWYANRYNCTVAEAIADRDHPATEAQCVAWFREATGRAPTQAEIVEMQPNSQTKVDEEIAYLRGAQ
jgi:hypothetical protein